MKPPKFGEPYVGMPATFLVGSDRYPATIVEVTHNKDGRVIKLGAQSDTSYRGEDGEWVYERNPKGDIRYYTLRKTGRFKQKGWALKSPGGHIGLGYREKYWHPSF